MSWLLLFIACLALSFALSGLESAVLTVSRVRLRHAAGSGDRRAAQLLPLIEDRDALLGAITVSNHITNLAAFLIMAWHFLPFEGPWGPLPAFLISLPLFLLGLEVLPKKLFRRYPFRSIRALTPLVLFAGKVRPLFRAFARREDTSTLVPDQSSGRDDLRQQARQLSRVGMLTPGAARLICSILDYRQRRIGHLMQTLNHSIALGSEQPLHAALIYARQHKLNTLPVLNDAGAFTGVLDLSRLPAQIPGDRLVRHHMRTLEVVRENDTALAALQHLRKRGQTLALVLAVSGEPVGLIREEDLLHHLLQAPDSVPAFTAAHG